MRIESRREVCTYQPPTTYVVKRPTNSAGRVESVLLAKRDGLAVCKKPVAPIRPPERDSGGGLLAGVGRFFARLGKGLLEFPSRVISAATSLVAGLVDTFRAAAHNFWDNRHPALWLAAARQTVEDAVVVLGGRAVSAVQTVTYLEAPGEPVAAELKREMRRIFGESVDLDSVRIKRRFAGVFSANGRPFAHGNVIYTKGERVDAELLAHELVHVWQHQNGGPDYMAKALGAQAHGDAYEWQKGVSQGKRWRDLDPEQQAQLIADAWKGNYFTSGDDEQNARFVHGGVDYTDSIRAALAELRAGRGAP